MDNLGSAELGLKLPIIKNTLKIVKAFFKIGNFALQLHVQEDIFTIVKYVLSFSLRCKD